MLESNCWLRDLYEAHLISTIVDDVVENLNALPL